MLWIYAPGRGWVLQSPAPAFQGCVITPAVPRSFGLASTARVAGVLAVILLLGWMWAAGHHVEVVGAVAAAVLVDVLRERVFASLKVLRVAAGLRLRGGDA